MHSVSLKITSTWNGRNIYNFDLGMGSNTLHYHLVFSFCFIFLYSTAMFQNQRQNLGRLLKKRVKYGVKLEELKCKLY